MASGRSANFSQSSELVGSNIQKISNNVTSLQRMVGQLGTAQDSESLRTKLHEIQHSTNALAKDTGQQLRLLMEIVESSDDDVKSQYRLLQKKLAERLASVLNKFQHAQRDAAQREKASIARARANSSVPTNANPFADDGTESATSDWSAATGGTVDSSGASLQIEQNVDMQAIQERELAIKQLESDILDVNQIFKDLAGMVHEQGEVVDSIEANVETAATEVQAASTEIAKARDYQRGIRKKRVICIALLIAVVVLLIIIIYFSVKH